MSAGANFWAEDFFQEDFWAKDFWAHTERKIITRAKISRADFALWDVDTKTTKRLDVTGSWIEELTVGENVDVLQVYGDGVTRSSAVLSKAIDYIGTDTVCLLLGTGHWLVVDDTTIPSNISCRIAAGCSLDVTSGKVLTFNGPVYVENPTWWTGDEGAVLTNLGADGFPNY